MDKKTIIGVSIAGVVVLIAVTCWFVFSINSKTKEAEEAAAEFTTLLQAGEYETLSLDYYAYSTAENKVITDENGVGQVQIVTKQQMAEMFGSDAVKSEEASARDQLLKTIMKYSQIQTSVATVWSESTSMSVYLLVPDIKTWMNQLTQEDIAYLNSLEEGQLADLTSRMASGEIAQQYYRFVIPMVKQNGKWRFEVTEDMENLFFGGLLNPFEAKAEE